MERIDEKRCKISPFDGKVVYQRVFNTIKLYAKQRRLISIVSDQIHEKEKSNQMCMMHLSANGYTR